MQDKILLGLVALGIIAGFVAMSGHDVKEEPRTARGEQAAVEGGHAKGEGQKAEGDKEQGEEDGVFLTPVLANDFVKWWLGGAMDFNPATAHKNHIEANKWMTPKACARYEELFWNSDRARDILNGNLTMKFQPISVEPMAVNQDGSIVIAVKGIMVSSQPGNPNLVREQIETDYLVMRAANGLRIGGLYNRILSEAPAPSYY